MKGTERVRARHSNHSLKNEPLVYVECKNLWHWTQSYNTRGGSEGGFGGGVLEEEETRRGGEGARGARGEEGGRGEVEEGRRERTWWEREAGGRGREKGSGR